MLLEASPKVHHAHHTVDDGNDNQNDGDDGESCHRLLDRRVERSLGRVIDPGQLEDEVGKTTDIEKGDEDHTPLPFASCEPCRTKQDGDRDWDGSTSQTKFAVCLASNDDEELYGETNEEEEIELEQRDINLNIYVSMLGL